MGLDITAYSRLERLDPQPQLDEYGRPDETDDLPDNILQVYVNKAFPGREGSLEDRCIYTYAEEMACLSRSYSGYSFWRRQLAALGGYTPEQAWAGRAREGAPFVDLVNFSDCEGEIGPEVCARLLSDFIAYEEKALAHPDEYFRLGYAEMLDGLKLAADSGCLSFH